MDEFKCPNCGYIYSESKKLQDELEPIIHPTQRDESDEIEAEKLAEGELTEFEKSELRKKVGKRSVWGNKEAEYTDTYWKLGNDKSCGGTPAGWIGDNTEHLNNPSLIAREEEPEEVEESSDGISEVGKADTAQKEDDPQKPAEVPHEDESDDALSPGDGSEPPETVETEQSIEEEENGNEDAEESGSEENASGDDPGQESRDEDDTRLETAEEGEDEDDSKDAVAENGDFEEE